MGLWAWLTSRLRGRKEGDREIVELRGKIHQLQRDAESIAVERTEINNLRANYQRGLHDSPTEEEDRLWSQKLRGLDAQERALKVRELQVDRQITAYRSSYENLRNLRAVNVRDLQRDLDHLNAIADKRTDDIKSATDIEREFEARNEDVLRAVERAVQQNAPDPYMEAKRVLRAQASSSGQASPQPPQHA